MPLPFLAIPLAAEMATVAVGAIILNMSARMAVNTADDASRRTGGAILLAAAGAGLTYYVLKKMK